MDRTMGDVCGALADQHAELWGLIAGLDDGGWQRPSRCEGWDVADVVLHMAQTDEMALATLEGRAGSSQGSGFLGVDPATLEDSGLGPGATVDDLAAWAVERERGAPGPQVAERWRNAAEKLRATLVGYDPHQRVRWVSGQISSVSIATTRLAECWIHTGDVAEALGRPQEPADRLRFVARLAWRTLPYAFSRAGKELHGPVAFHLHGPDGDRWDFDPDDEPLTVVEGDGFELCLVAAQRVTAADTKLQATGPDAADVLDLVRTYA